MHGFAGGCRCAGFLKPQTSEPKNPKPKATMQATAPMLPSSRASSRIWRLGLFGGGWGFEVFSGSGLEVQMSSNACFALKAWAKLSTFQADPQAFPSDE